MCGISVQKAEVGDGRNGRCLGDKLFYKMRMKMLVFSSLLINAHIGRFLYAEKNKIKQV